MGIIKKIGHYILFIIGGYIGTWLVLAICTILPFLGFLLIYSLGDFWFLFLGSIMMTIYYMALFGLLGWYYEYIDKRKPDYWFSNIFIALVALLFFYTLITSLGPNVSKEPKAFLNFKGIVFLISIIPAYLRILYVSLLLPFIGNRES